jgi:hypothetical protein
MEVTIPTRTEPMKTAAKETPPRFRRRGLEPDDHWAKPEMLSCRIAFDDRSPQYLSGEDE